MAGQRGFFDVEERYAKLSATGDPLETLAAPVDFELFRVPLARALKRSDRRLGGRPAMDAVMMFKILVLQALYGLSDDQAEFQIRDRLTFMRFLGLGLHDVVPDAKTIWLFREHLTRAKAIDRLFERFDAALRDRGYLALSGQIIDASIVAAPAQRNSEEEKAAIREGRIPEDWEDKPAKLAQKDRDARWTLKRSRPKRPTDGEAKSKAAPEITVPVFGYKNHVGIDRRHRLIRAWTVSDAAAHDGARLAELLDKTNLSSRVWADTAYRSAKNERHLARNGFTSMIHFRKPPGKPLPGQRARANAARSRVRAHVEHVFAGQKHRMGLFVRSIGMARARTRIGMANLVYNMTRVVWLERRPAPT